MLNTSETDINIVKEDVVPADWEVTRGMVVICNKVTIQGIEAVRTCNTVLCKLIERVKKTQNFDKIFVSREIKLMVIRRPAVKCLIYWICRNCRKNQ